ncbi:hypothetical protein [Flavobacterium ajazii]|uniref:hypothetical protein n=1 Tax=Flavobacterium ajazii TaxID=2692318 RepID=UPI0013D13458|nr:hypothetical protein [Flavobacterium ajazii]
MSQETMKQSSIALLQQQELANEICLIMQGQSIEFCLKTLDYVKQKLNEHSTANMSKEKLDNDFERLKKNIESEYKFSYSSLER